MFSTSKTNVTTVKTVLRLKPPTCRAYARVVGGLLNQPPPPAPQVQRDQSVGQSQREKLTQNNIQMHFKEKLHPQKTQEFELDISKPPKSTQNVFKTVQEPPIFRPNYALHQHLIDIIQSEVSVQKSPSLQRLLLELDSKANTEIPHLLKNGNAGAPQLSLNEIAESVVSVAHILPPSKTKAEGEVIMCSGFSILDGSLIATCAHPFFQINAHCRSYDAIDQQLNTSLARTIIITNSGRVLPIVSLESHLVMGDVVVLRIPSDSALQPLQVSPYPCPAGNPIQVYNLQDTFLSDMKVPLPKWSWRESEITLYQDRAGREAATGSYDELNTLLFDSVPLAGSSGGPILDRETKAVVGIVRGSEISYAVRKERGFGTPAETLFNVFKLDM